MTRGILYKIVVLCAVSAPKAIEIQPAFTPGLSDYFMVRVTPGADPSHVCRGVVQRSNDMGHLYTNAVRGFSIKLPLGLAKQVIEIQTGLLLVGPDVPVCTVAQTLPTGVDRGEADHGGANSPVDVHIAIIDAGIDIDHPDLSAVGGRHFYSRRALLSSEGDQYDDDSGRGKHCAAIVAAKDNDLGMIDVAHSCGMHSVKVLDSPRSGYLSNVTASVDWAAPMQVQSRWQVQVFRQKSGVAYFGLPY